VSGQETRTRWLADGALAGRTVWITGGGTGLGRAMALRFAELGAGVGLSGRRPEPLEETAAVVRAMDARRPSRPAT
jgi:NAD(P)-dependent dehydrogenase (short-subunit alcohol dehydrogenase family)